MRNQKATFELGHNCHINSSKAHNLIFLMFKAQRIKSENPKLSCPSQNKSNMCFTFKAAANLEKTKSQGSGTLSESTAFHRVWARIGQISGPAACNKQVEILKGKEKDIIGRPEDEINLVRFSCTGSRISSTDVVFRVLDGLDKFNEFNLNLIININIKIFINIIYYCI